MAVVAGIVAVGTAAAATGAAAAAGTYGIYKFFKRRTRQRRRPNRDEDEMDFGRELDVYKVTETRIPPPVAPKPKRDGKSSTKVVTKQPSLEQRKQVSAETTPKNSEMSRETFITRLCPNAVKVLPDPPEYAAQGPRAALRSRSHTCGEHMQKAKDPLLSQNNDVIAMKTLLHKVEEEYIK